MVGDILGTPGSRSNNSKVYFSEKPLIRELKILLHTALTISESYTVHKKTNNTNLQFN